MNVTKATFEALSSQKQPDDIAKMRGKKLADVQRTYYAGDQ
jgi:ribosomal protein S5